ncbi:MAG: aminomethyl-transferring glycine dehydrogenase subunit GcvPB [Polyangiales bacterium]
MQFNEPSIFELGEKGRSGASFPTLDVPHVPASRTFGKLARGRAAALPEVSEPEAIRHFTRISQWNFSIDTNFYPLGSCTMKHNPRVNEWAARLPGFAMLHPYARASAIQGALELMARLRDILAEVCGMDDVSLQPAAGAQGELTGLMMIRAHHLKQGRSPTKVLIPETAHGTNPASCALNGLTAVPFTSANGDGVVDPADVARLLDQHRDDVAAIMITNPNTLGLFERHIVEIAKMMHEKGGLVYGDGANLNALMGRARPGDLGIDIMQFNLHKTFTTPHGGGGPGCGPVAFKSFLAPYQPSPVVVSRARSGNGAAAAAAGATGGVGGPLFEYYLDDDRKESVGRVRSFYGNFGMMVRAYAYIREMGPTGLKQASDLAVLNANYAAARIKAFLPLAYDRICMHEAIFTDRDLKKATSVQTLDIAKRLIDYGFHPPTVYFPLVVPGALMIEPTETETKQTIDWFVEALRAIVEEAKSDPDQVKKAPHETRLARLDEARAARKPVLRWSPAHNTADTSNHELSSPPATHSTEG